MRCEFFGKKQSRVKFHVKSVTFKKAMAEIAVKILK